MKKIFTLLAVAAMAFTAYAAEPIFLNMGTVPVLDAEGQPELGTDGKPKTKPNYSSISGDYTDIYTGTAVQGCDGLKWVNNAVTMFLVKADKTYSGGITNTENNKSIKLSNGAPNVLNLPEGFTVGTIEFYGYCNDKNAGRVAYIASILNEAGETVYEGTEAGETLPRIAALPGYDAFVPEGEKKDDEFWASFTLDQMPKITCKLTKPVSGKLWFKNGGKQPCVYIKLIPADDQSGIADIVADENAPVEYFNLQGIRVANPENGLYIRRQGNKVEKILVK